VLLEALMARAFESFLRAAPSGCLEWTGVTVKSNGRDSHRYGRFTRNGAKQLAHRVAYERAHGPIPPGMQALHRCDNPLCCNPAHLFLGTHAENMGDMAAKGRASRRGAPPRHGEANPRAKLRDAEIAEIRARRASGETVTSLASAFDVHHSHISRVARGIRR
jgi:hypothetical protein